jgi:hypothetical protein
MRPKEFTKAMQLSEVVRAQQDKVGHVPKEKYEEGMMVGTLVQNELKHIALMAS